MKLAIKLGFLSATSLGIAFLFQWYVFVHLGPGIETDALFAGMTIPQLVLAVISGSLMHVLVPVFSGESEEQLRHNAWTLFFLVGGLFCLLAILLYVSAAWWVPLTVPGFNESGQALTVNLTRIQLFGMVFAAINGVQWAAYHARQQFLWAEFSPILASVIAFFLLVLTLPHFGVIAAAWIGLLKAVLQTFLLIPGMGRIVKPDMKSAAIKEVWRRLKPLLLGTAYYKTDPVVDRFFLSLSGSGSLSLYYLAQQIYGAAGQVLNKAVAVPLVPVLSRLYKAADMDGFRRAYYLTLLKACLVTIAGLAVLGISGKMFLAFLIGHGSVTAGNVSQLWWIMILLAGVFLGGVAGQICSSSFYAFGDTKTPTRISMLTYTVYIPFKVASFYFWNMVGLAVVTSIYYMANLLLMVYFLEKNLSYGPKKRHSGTCELS